MTLPTLDAVIHAPVRLGLMAVLRALPDNRELAFSQLQHLLALSPGNLSTHLRKLEEIGYVAVAKTFRDRVPVTTVALTAAGRIAYDDYVRAMTRYLDGSAATSLLRTEDAL